MNCFSKHYKYFFICAYFFISGCIPSDYRIKQLSSNYLKEDPALSGDGSKLAFVTGNNGNKFIRLQNLKTGRFIPLRYISRYKPNLSPSLSWNGRYVAAIINIGNRPIPAIEDVVSGRFYRLPTFAFSSPVSLSLSPDASKIVIQFYSNGKRSFRFYDLSDLLELDLSRNLGQIKPPI